MAAAAVSQATVQEYVCAFLGLDIAPCTSVTLPLQQAEQGLFCHAACWSGLLVHGLKLHLLCCLHHVYSSAPAARKVVAAMNLYLSTYFSSHPVFFLHLLAGVFGSVAQTVFCLLSEQLHVIHKRCSH